MQRRNYLKSVASLPLIPSIPIIGKNEPENGTQTYNKEEYWEISSAWFPDHNHGDLMLLKNGEEEHRWKYEDYSLWQKVTLLNSHAVADCDYVADLFNLNLHEIYIDPPFFQSIFRGEAGEVRIRRWKYSDVEYRYYIRTEDLEKEFGSEDLQQVIEDIGRKLGE